MQSASSVTNYQAPDNLLQDRVILVTGASDGIGKAVAKEFARVGATVILHGRDISRLETVYDEIIAEGYPQPAIIPLNLVNATTEQCNTMADTIQAELGRLDGILHNAGMLTELTSIEYTSAEDWQQVMQVNLDSVFLLTQACLPLLYQSDSASIIMTSSGVGRKGRALWGAYAVSKFAIEGLVQVLADELKGSRVRVNAINPGATRTKMRALAFPTEDINQLKKPEEIVPVYLYLMGDDSTGISGRSINAQP